MAARLSQRFHAVIAKHGKKTIIGIQNVMGIRPINKNASGHSVQYAVLYRMIDYVK